MTPLKCKEDQDATESSPDDAASRHDDTDDDKFTEGIQSQHFNISLIDVTI